MVTSKKRGITGLSFGPCSVLYDIEDVVSSKILKFADDTKLYSGAAPLHVAWDTATAAVWSPQG